MLCYTVNFAVLNDITIHRSRREMQSLIESSSRVHPSAIVPDSSKGSQQKNPLSLRTIDGMAAP